jgi:hypothetical protein
VLRAMHPDVVAVTPLAHFCLDVGFANGEKKRFDVRPFLHLPVFQRLHLAGYFDRAHVENGTVVWDEQLDLSPDTLYLQGVPVPP